MVEKGHLRRRLLRPILAAAVAMAASRAAYGWGAAEPEGDLQSWIRSPYRSFGAPRPLPPGRAALYDEKDDPALVAALAAELRRLDTEIYGAGGWRVPFAEGETLRIYVARGEASGMRRLAARSVEKGRLVGPAVLLDATGLTGAQIVREVSRQIARATLEGYGVGAGSPLTTAVAELLAGGRVEEAWIDAAAPWLDFASRPETLGRAWVEEVARDAGGMAFLRRVWEEAGERREDPLAVFRRLALDATGEPEEVQLLRAAGRLYGALEPEASPSRLTRLDLTAGALDTAPPGSLAVRHRTFLADGAEDALRVAWPEDGGLGAAIVRYRDPALPADAVTWRAGEVHTIPLSGVARIDWVVAGVPAAGRPLRAPAFVDASDGLPYRGLSPHASVAAEGARLAWTTEAHAGLVGWAIFREQVLPDGRVSRSGPEIVPSSERSEESFGYVFLDPKAAAGMSYRYSVWAVTDEGLLAHAFSVTVR